MRYFILSLFLLSPFSEIFATCPKCEVIREYNKAHPGDYEFYEDFLEAEKKGKKEEIKKTPEKKDTKTSPEK